MRLCGLEQEPKALLQQYPCPNQPCGPISSQAPILEMLFAVAHLCGQWKLVS